VVHAGSSVVRDQRSVQLSGYDQADRAVATLSVNKIDANEKQKGRRGFTRDALFCLFETVGWGGRIRK